MKQQWVSQVRYFIACGDDDALEQLLSRQPHLDAQDLAELHEMAQDAEAEVRWWGLRALAKANPAGVAPLLRQALDDAAPFVRGSAALLLGELQVIDAVGQLADRLRSEEAWVRTCLADALALLGAPAASALTEALDDPQDSVRVQAARVLAKMRLYETAGPLFRALQDPNYLVSTYARDALEGMGLLDDLLVQ